MKVFHYRDFYNINDDKHPNVMSVLDMLINFNVGLFILDKSNAVSLTGNCVSDLIH